MKEFRLHYHISNNGDGSASVHLHPSADEASKADEEQNENGDGWGEDCSSFKSIFVENGKLFYRKGTWDHKKKSYDYTYIPLEEIKANAV